MFYFLLHRLHRGEVIGLAFSPDGDSMFSADSEGSLALYDASEEDHSVIRVACMYCVLMHNQTCIFSG